jgi:PAS domain S-box-containing protein
MTIPFSTKTSRPLIFSWLPWTLALMAVGLTSMFAYQAHRAEREREQSRFNFEVQETLDHIRNRLQVYVNFLVATRAHLMLQSTIEAKTFYPYISQLDIEKSFPGLRGVGYAEHVEAHDMHNLLGKMRREGYSEFRVFPGDGDVERYPIVYLYPQDTPNQRAIGYNMFSEPNRRVAMSTARDTGQPIATAPITLVQEVHMGEPEQPGFLIYLPIYAKPAPSTPEERAASIVGFVYSPFRMKDFLAGIFGGTSQPILDFSVYDGEDRRFERPLYQSAQFEAPLPSDFKPQLSTLHSIDVAGRTWLLQFQTRPAFHAHAQRIASNLILLIGVLITPLSFGMGWVISWAHRRTERQREWLRVTLASIGDAVVATDDRGVVLFMNPTAERLLGWEEQEAIGLPSSRIIQLCDHDSGLRIDDPVQRILQSRQTLTLSNIAVKHRTGILIPIEDSTSPILNDSGRITGAILVFHDATARKQQERLDAATAEVVRILAYASSLDQVAEELVRAACRGLRCDGGTLWTLDDSGTYLRRRGRVGTLLYDDSFAREIVSKGAPLWHSLEGVPREQLEASCGTGEAKSIVGFPLIVDGQVRGALDLVAERELSFDETTVQWLSSLGLRIGQLIERKREETRRRAIIEGAFDSIISFDNKAQILDMNEAAETMFGVPREQLRGSPITRILDLPDFDPAHLTEPERQTRLNRVITTTGRTPDGSQISLEITVTEAVLEGASLFTAFIRNVSEQTRRHAELVIQNQILHNMSEGVCLADASGIIIFNNKAQEELLGYSPGEMIGKNISLVLGTSPASGSDALHGFRNEIEIRRRDGSAITTLTQISEILFLGRRYFLCVQDDITDRKEAEYNRTRLLESERAARSQLERASQIKDEFLATLSHELRTPLNAILGWSQLIKRGVLDKARLDQGLEVIEKNARVQAQIIGDLLDMSRIVSGKVRLETRPVSIASIVQAAVETITPTAQLKNITIETHLSPLLGTLNGDPNRLQQVFWNLLSNAVRFSLPGGQVVVEGQTAPQGVEISVRDFGEGIKPEFVPHVFDRFRQGDASTTRKHGGLGLGLSIVKQLVELHGGEVRASSAGPGTGATFTVTLPRSGAISEQEKTNEPQRASSRHPYQSELPSLEGRRVIAVDDEEDARNLLKVILEEQGALVTTAASAGDAMRALEREKPDLIVSDISMPDEDGYAFIRKVRARGVEHGGEIPAIALTAFARPEDQAAALAAGFQIHLSKPIDPARLVSSVARMLAH